MLDIRGMYRRDPSPINFPWGVPPPLPLPRRVGRTGRARLGIGAGACFPQGGPSSMPPGASTVVLLISTIWRSRQQIVDQEPCTDDPAVYADGETVTVKLCRLSIADPETRGPADVIGYLYRYGIVECQLP